MYCKLINKSLQLALAYHNLRNCYCNHRGGSSNLHLSRLLYSQVPFDYFTVRLVNNTQEMSFVKEKSCKRLQEVNRMIVS